MKVDGKGETMLYLKRIHLEFKIEMDFKDNTSRLKKTSGFVVVKDCG